MICPCQNRSKNETKAYSECCEPFHLKIQKPETPEQLMRSRYSAFYLANGQYIYDTHHVDYRENTTVDDYQQSAKSTHWCRLEIIQSSQTMNSGIVEFKAYFIDKEKLHCLHEKSNFLKIQEQWFYTNGEFQPKKVEKISRNDLCPCHSGLKAKKCCLK